MLTSVYDVKNENCAIGLEIIDGWRSYPVDGRYGSKTKDQRSGSSRFPSCHHTTHFCY